ncbi:MAG: hypothetical protein IKV97_06295 [Clostridia bacterium]|nr:hypothetical protein [Clostridia bacterium]
MKKIRLLLAALTLVATATVTAHATDVIIDGTKVNFDANSGYPFISEGRTLVPLRATMEAFGAEVMWDGEKSTAIVTKDVTTVTCSIGQNCIYRNGTPIINDASAVIVDGRTYLPIRAVLEALDATVSWDGNVIVTSPGASNLVYSIENSGKRVSNMWKAWTDALSLKESGNYAQCIESMKQLAPTFLAANDDNSDAMLYKHLGECYNALEMRSEAAACFMRESEKWVTAGLPQAAIDAKRRATLSNSVVQLFASTYDDNYDGIFFGERYEPRRGAYIGVTLKNSDPKYMEIFPEIVNKDMSGYLIYSYSVEPVKTYQHTFKKAASENKIVQFALQPYDLADFLSIRKDDPKYIKIAKDLHNTDAKVFVRFACEMNDETSAWYTTPEEYIERFRYVADIFHTYAPNCPVVWSPNFYPADTMDDYYPGDKYVDYVGISAYAEYQPETDPLGMGIDRNRFSTVLDKIVSLYGHKKPIIVSECGASYRNIHTGGDITDFAASQLNDFFTYLPIKYPQVKAVFLFETVDAAGIREFRLENNSKYAEAFINAIRSDSYLSKLENDPGEIPVTFEIGNNVRLPASPVDLHAFVKTTENDFSYVVYRINGTDVGVAYDIPYTLGIDLSPYSGQTIELSCLAFDSSGKMCAQKTYKVKVS